LDLTGLVAGTQSSGQAGGDMKPARRDALDNRIKDIGEARRFIGRLDAGRRIVTTV
jgi:hypothetical protein